ncbi:16610_t:CDS:2 [Cetraspora pellucida]|uniref:16610_t:CDS:1 n=1 Tax=Cetraspora pellucida TaxID=1433469 RepID=A0A9N9A6R5_9GLOM|nr:16610_t:CDS:2 [Cetraspora pellucida]
MSSGKLRSYATNACTNCQKRHVKCSGVVTCTNCKNRNLDCEFKLSKKRGPKPKPKNKMVKKTLFVPKQEYDSGLSLTLSDKLSDNQQLSNEIVNPMQDHAFQNATFIDKTFKNSYTTESFFYNGSLNNLPYTPTTSTFDSLSFIASNSNFYKEHSY